MAIFFEFFTTQSLSCLTKKPSVVTLSFVLPFDAPLFFTVIEDDANSVITVSPATNANIVFFMLM